MSRKLLNSFTVKALLIAVFSFVSIYTKAQVGGPNGYTFSSAVSAGAWDTNFTSAPVVWQQGTGCNFDSISYAVPITLPGGGFTFNCRKYTTLRIAANGFVFFENPLLVPQNQYTVGLGASGNFTNSAVNAASGTTGLYADGVIQPFGFNLVRSKVAGANPQIRYGNIGANNFVISFEDLSRNLATASGDSLDRINFQIWLSASGTVKFVYGNCTPSNSTVASTATIGIRGGHNSDWNTRLVNGSSTTIPAGLDYLNSGVGTSSATTVIYRGPLVATTPNNVYPPVDLTWTWTPPACNTPTYQPIPAVEDFENTWAGNSEELPTTSWKNWPGRGQNSWRRNDVASQLLMPTTTAIGGVTTLITNNPHNWTSITTGNYTVAGTGALGSQYSARFHSSSTSSKHHGDLDWYVDPSSCGANPLNLNYYYVNAAGATDTMQVWLSTDGGLTFPNRLDTLNASFAPVSTVWSQRNIVIPAALIGGSSTCVIRFRAFSDGLTGDIGLDRITLAGVGTAPTVTVSGSDSIICAPGQGTSSSTLTASGATNYIWYPAAGLSSQTGASVTATPSNTTVYTVVGTDAACVSASSTVSVKVNGQINVGVTLNPTLPYLCLNDSINLSAVDTTLGGNAMPNGYCVQYSTSTADEEILAVIFPNTLGYPNRINNAATIAAPTVGTQGTGTIPSGLANNQYTSWIGSSVPIPTIYTGQTYPISVQVGTTGTAFGNSVRVFLDLNRDGDFLDASENFFTQTGSQTGAATVNGTTVAVPTTGVVPGLTRMRVASSETTTATSILSCNTLYTLSFGEIEDYTVRLATMPVPATSSALAYTWNPSTFLDTTAGVLNQADSVTATTTYTITGSSASGCSATSSFTLFVTPMNTPTITSNPVSVCLGQSATLTGTASGGGAPYTFKWYDSTNGNLLLSQTTNVNTANVTVTPTVNNQIYKLVVLDQCGDSSMTTYTMSLFPNPVVVITPYVGSTLQICNTTASADTITATGAATYTWVSAPTGTLNYVMSPTVKDTVIMTATANTTFTVTGTSVNGCTSTATATMNFLANYNIAITATPQDLCPGGTTVVKATDTVSGGVCVSPQPYCYTALHSGGPAPCVASISFGSLSSTLGSACVGTYYADTFSSVAQYKLGLSYPMTINFASLTSGYAGVWIDFNRNGNYDPTEFTNVVTNNTGGTVSIVVPGTAVLGCTKMRVRTRSTSIAAADACATFADGETVDYLVTLFNSSYTSLASSVWTVSDPGVTLTTVNSTSQSASPITQPLTTFSVVTTDANGCSKAGTVSVNVQPLNCGNLTATGVTATGPLATYYDNGFSSATLTNSSISGSASIAGGLLTLHPASASQLGALLVNASGVNSNKYQTYFKFNTTGTPANMADGLSYSFSNDGTPLLQTGMNAENGTGTKVKLAFVAFPNAGSNRGIYLMYNSTTNEQTPTGAGVLGYVNDTTWMNTAGNEVLFSIDEFGKVNMSLNGVPKFTNVQLPTAYTAANKASWTHIFKARTGTITMSSIIDSVNIQQALTTNAICLGNPVNLIVTPTFGGAPYTYAWSYDNGAGSTALPNTNSSISTTPSSPGTYTYTVIVSDACGSTCSATNVVTVGGLPAVTITPSVSPAVVCFSGSIGLTANPSGGTGTYGYNWTGGGLAAPTNVAAVTATPGSLSNPYQVTISDAYGCSATASITVTKSFNYTITASANPTSLGTCPGTVTLISLDTSLGQGPTVLPTGYCAQAATSAVDEEILGVIFPNTGGYPNQINNTSAPATGNLSGSQGTATGVVSMYSDWTGSTVPIPSIITGNTYPVQVSIGTTGTAFSNATKVFIDFNRDGDFADAGETAYADVATTAGAHLVNGNITVPTTGVNAGYTRMRVVNSETAPASVTACNSASGGTNINWGEVEDYIVNITAPAPNQLPSTSFVWTSTPAATFTPGSGIGDTVLANISTATVFTVTASDANGCTKTASVTVNQGPLVCQPMSKQFPFVCMNKKDTLTANATAGGTPYTYQWYDGPTNAGPVVATTQKYDAPTSTVGTNYFTVVITDACGATCSVTDSIIVQALPQLTVTSSIPSNLGICSTGTDTLTATSATIPTITKIQWLPATAITYVNPAPDSTKVVISAPPLNATTTYTCILTDQTTLCTNTVTTTVNYAPTFSVSLTSSSLTNGGCSTDTLTASTALNLINDSINDQVMGTGYIGGNGSTGITFVLKNSNPFPVPITNIRNFVSFTSGPFTVNLWKHPTNLSGLPGTLSTANGWTLVETFAHPGLPTAGVQVPLFNGSTAAPIDTIPANSIWRYAIDAPITLTYTTAGASTTPDSFFKSGISMMTGDYQIAGLNTGYGGGVNTPRAFTGTILFGVNNLPFPVTSYVWSNTGLDTVVGVNSPLDSIVLATPDTTTTYTVTATNSIGCTATTSVTISVGSITCDSLTATLGTICVGQTTNLKVFHQLGSPTYSYTVADGISTITTTSSTIPVSPTVTTTYTVTAFSSCGDSCVQNITINVNPLPVISSITNTLPVICNAGSSTLVANATGAGTLTYLWTGGTPSGGSTPTNDSTNVTPTVNTTYSVLVTDANTCTNTSTVEVIFSPAYTVQVAVNPTNICAGDTSSLIVLDTVSGPQTQPTGYCAQAAQFTSDEEIFNITFPNIGGFPNQINNTTPCIPTSLTGTQGTATGTAEMYSDWTASTVPVPTITAGGTYPMSIQIGTCGGNFSNLTKVFIDFNRDGDFLDASETAYTQPVFVNGPNTISASVTVPNSALPGVTRMRVVNNETSLATGVTSCNAAGGGTTITWGEAEDYLVNVLATPLIPVTSLAWTDTSTLSTLTLNATNDTGSAYPTVTTSYTVTATNAVGCTATTSVSVNVNPLIITSLTASSATLCAGFNDTLATTVTGGGTPYSIVWSPSPATTIDSANVVVTPTTVPVEVYTVTVTDVCGNTSTSTISINVNPIPVISVTSPDNPSGIVCNPPVVDTMASTCATCVSYAWSGPTTLLPSASVPTVTTNIATVNQTNIYTVVGTNVGGCTSSATWTISTTKPHVLNIIADDNLYCYGDSAILTISDTTLVSGPQTPPTGYCAQAAQFTSDEEIINVTFPNTGGYPNQINNTSGCGAGALTGSQGTATGTFEMYSDWTASTVPVPTLTVGTTYPMSVQIGTCGGNFSNMTKVFIDFNRDGDFLDAGETAYQDATFTNGPHTISTINIPIPSTAVPGVTVMRVVNNETTLAASVTSCNAAGGGTTISWGEAEDYKINLINYGLASGMVYTWNPTVITIGLDSVLAGPLTLSPSTYVLTATDSLGCIFNDTINLIVNPEIITTGSMTNPTCNGNSDGSIIASTTGGTPGYSYSWNTIIPNLTNTYNGQAGTFELTTTDTVGCVTIDTFVLTQPDPVNVSVVVGGSLCFGTGTGYAYVDSAWGGTGPYTYTWLLDTMVWNDVSVMGDSAYNLLPDTTYKLFVTDANNCFLDPNIYPTLFYEFTTSQPASPLSLDSLVLGAPIACNGDSSASVTVYGSGGTPGYTYSSDGITFDTLSTLSSLGAGTYTITIRDNNLCTQTATVTITEPTVVVASATSTNITCNGSANGTITVSGSGGTSPYQYSIDGVTFVPTSSFTGVDTGTYTVYVDDAMGCIGTTSVIITEPTAVSASSTATDLSCYNSADGSIVASGTGGTVPYTYSIDSVTYVSTDTFQNLTAGTYTVYVKDSNGCVATTIQVVTEPTQISVVASATPNPAVTSDTVTFSNTTVPATGLTYAWSGPNAVSDTNSSFALNGVMSNASGIYTLVVTDGTGCTASNTVALTVNPAIQVAMKVFLSGPYVVATGLMKADLRDSNIIPNVEPYSIAPYSPAFVHVGGGGGETMPAGALAVPSSNPNAVVDWIFVQVRSAADSSVVVATQSALLQRDGDVVSAKDGVSPLIFKATPIAPGNYFISVKHRNHLGVMTATAQALTETPSLIDFTSTSTSLYTRPAPANNAFPYSTTQSTWTRIFGGTVRALYAGNTNLLLSGSAYRIIRYNGLNNDRLTIAGIAPGTSTVTGYRKEDVNMDGRTRYNGIANDRLVLLQNVGLNANTTVNEQTPN